MKANGDRIPLIKARADCRQLYKRYFHGHYIEGRTHSLCAFHDDRSPSLKVDKENCHCFGSCKKSYDAIDIVAKGANCSISEAIDLLCEELGIIPANGRDSAGDRKSTKPTQDKKRDYTEEFQRALRTKPPREALEYLERRKISSMLSELQEKKLIGFKSGNEKFPPAIVVTVTNLDKEILGLQYIPTDGSEKKFASGSEPGTYKDRGFFPLNRGDGEIVLVESVIDAISLAAAMPMKNAAAILSSGFIEKVQRYGVKIEPPMLFFDRDEAGQKATAKAVEILHGRCKVVDWGLAPEGMKDVNDLLQASHTDLIAKMVSDAKPPVAPKSSDSRETDGWETPSDLTRTIPPAPEFPLECLPYRAANYASDESQRMQSPVDLIAVPMIVCFAGLIGKDATIRPKANDNWTERPCLWAAIISPVASMKSQNQSKATAPLRRVQRKLVEKDMDRIKEWKSQSAKAGLREKAWKKRCDQILDRDQDAELPPVPEEVENLPPEPKPQRILTNDATVEKLADLMSTSRGITLVRDELAGFLLNMSRYNSGSDRQFYLECYSGGAYSVDRVIRGETFVDDLYLNIVGGIQPGVAKKLFSSDSDATDGFFERFGLTIYPEPIREFVLVDRKPNKGMRDLFNELCDRLASTDWEEVLHTDDFGNKPFASFDQEAQALFNEWLVDHMRQLRSMNDGDPIVGMMGKARGLLVRLVLVLHLAAWAGGEALDPETIATQSLLRALKLLEDYLIPMWRRIHATFGKTASDTGAIRIANHILAKKLKEIRIRDVLQKKWQGLISRDAVESAFEVLIENTWLGEPSNLSRGGQKGGRKTHVYPVNPRVFELSSQSGEGQK